MSTASSGTTSAEGLRGEILERGDLGEGEPSALSLLRRGLEHLMRVWKRALPAGFDEALQIGVPRCRSLLVTIALAIPARGSILRRGDLARAHGSDQAPEHQHPP